MLCFRVSSRAHAGVNESGFRRGDVMVCDEQKQTDVLDQ